MINNLITILHDYESVLRLHVVFSSECLRLTISFYDQVHRDPVCVFSAVRLVLFVICETVFFLVLSYYCVW